MLKIQRFYLLVMRYDNVSSISFCAALYRNYLPLNYSSGIATTTHQASESSRSHVRHGSRKGVEQVEIDVPNPPQMKPVVLRSAKHVSALHTSSSLFVMAMFRT